MNRGKCGIWYRISGAVVEYESRVGTDFDAGAQKILEDEDAVNLMHNRPPLMLQ